MDETRRGSVEVFEGIWQNYLDTSGEPEFNAQQQLFAERKNEALLRILPPAPANVLECGSGSGEVSAFLAHHGYTVTLLDASPSALAFAEKRFHREGITGTFIQGNVYELPFTDGEFDIVMSFGLLEHFEDVAVVIREMSRVIRPGGMFFADIVTERFSVQTLGNIFNAAVRVAWYTVKGSPKTGMTEARKLFKPEFYENTYSPEAYLEMMRHASLDDVELHGNRPFPGLTLRGPAERVYAGFMRAAMPLWRTFDRSNSAFARGFGAGWWAWGTRRG